MPNLMPDNMPDEYESVDLLTQYVELQSFYIQNNGLSKQAAKVAAALTILEDSFAISADEKSAIDFDKWDSARQDMAFIRDALCHGLNPHALEVSNVAFRPLDTGESDEIDSIRIRIQNRIVQLRNVLADVASRLR